MHFKAALCIPFAALASVSGQCTQTETTGCLNGVSYDYATEFPCGSTMTDGSDINYNIFILDYIHNNDTLFYQGLHLCITTPHLDAAPKVRPPSPDPSVCSTNNTEII